MNAMPPPIPCPPSNIDFLDKPGDVLLAIFSAVSTVEVRENYSFEILLGRNHQLRLHTRSNFTQEFLLAYYEESYLEKFCQDFGGIKGFFTFDMFGGKIFVEHDFKTDLLWELGGVLYHELAHALQFHSFKQKGSEEMGWYDYYDNGWQTALHERWKVHLAGSYAGSNAAEAAAEVFRHTAGFNQYEGWEENEELIKDYEKFFKTQPSFSHLPFLR